MFQAPSKMCNTSFVQHLRPYYFYKTHKNVRNPFLLTFLTTSRIASPSALGRSRKPAVALRVIGVLDQYSVGTCCFAESKSSIKPEQIKRLQELHRY